MIYTCARIDTLSFNILSASVHSVASIYAHRMQRNLVVAMKLFLRHGFFFPPVFLCKCVQLRFPFLTTTRLNVRYCRWSCDGIACSLKLWICHVNINYYIVVILLLHYRKIFRTLSVPWELPSVKWTIFALDGSYATASAAIHTHIIHHIHKYIGGPE